MMQGCIQYSPSPADLSSPFEKFIQKIEGDSGKHGICKITPGEMWKPCRQGYQGQDGDRVIGGIEQQFTKDSMVRGVYVAGCWLLVAGCWLYNGSFPQLKRQSVKAFQSEAEQVRIPRSRGDVQDFLPGLEEAYWKGISGKIIYGADNEGSLFDKDIKEWNPANLDSCLSRGIAADPSGQKVKGVNTPYLYYGSWKSTFAWHTEDAELHSVNYLHYGAPKVWYCVAPKDKRKMDNFLANKLSAQHGQCKDFMRHKTIMIKPEVLVENHIPVQKVVQYPGDFIINFPGAYHAGFNTGFNCAESTNFATPAWIEHGALAGYCKCSPGEQSVRLDMRLFLDEAPNEHVRSLIRTHTGMAHIPAALAQVQGRAAAQATAQEGKSGTQQGKHRKGGALQKVAKGFKQLKKALQPSRAKRAKADTAGRPDSKKSASLLKMAKRAALAPSAAAKLPQAKITSSEQMPAAMPIKGSGSPHRARGQPRGCTKPPTATDHSVLHDRPNVSLQRTQQHLQLPSPQPQWQQQQQLSPQYLQQQQQSPQQQQPPQQQQQPLQQQQQPPQQQPQLFRSPPQPSDSARAVQAESRKRKRRAHVEQAEAVPEELSTQEAVQPARKKVAQGLSRWMSRGRGHKQTQQQQDSVSTTHSVLHYLPAQQMQQADAQQARAALFSHQKKVPKQAQTSSQADHRHQHQQLQPTQHAELKLDMPGPSNLNQETIAQLQGSKGNELPSSKGSRVNTRTAEAPFADGSGQLAKVPSAMLHWGSRRNRSNSTRRRVGSRDLSSQQLRAAQAPTHTQGGHVHHFQQVQAAQQAELNMRMEMPGPSRLDQGTSAQLRRSNDNDLQNKQVYPQLPSANMSAIFNEFQHEGLVDAFVDKSPEDLLDPDFVSTADAHEQHDAMDSVLGADRLSVEPLYDLASPYQYGAQNRFAVEEVAAVRPAGHDAHDDFDIDATLDDMLQ
ncbi:hypothetical protein ABBQ32_000197 [Trebouxia sp. C0010 RCD-2024]